MLSHDGKYLVALSGGADSVCLLLVLKELCYQIEAVHCNFHLRGEESNRDEMFCESLCNRLGISFHRIHFDTTTYAELHHVSIEMAARELRYKYFEQLANDIHADGICVAHHRDDSVETLLINLVRGTGIHGLTGISPVNGQIIRPLLDVSREEIEDYLRSVNQDYVTDSTNLQDDVVRNKIRLNIIPMLREINPSVSDNIALTAKRIAEAEKLFDWALEQKANECILEKDDNTLTIDFSLASQNEYILYHLLSPYRFTPSQIQQIAENNGEQSGKEWRSASHIAMMDRNRLLVCPLEERRKPMIVPELGKYVFTEKQVLSFQHVKRDADFQISKQNNVVCLDADLVEFPLTIRYVENGDRFVPFGMNGSKLVSDFLTNCKVSLYDKRQQLVVTDAHQQIIWLVNRRPHHHYCITDETKSVLIISTL
ncbi:MAG: tRNA lysidine(34) synthetase TilS [Prevotella sp.]|nr:tRNA lysidine(34) synthetase TilS [Prevotella sp.]